MNGTRLTASPEPMRILAADLSLRCPGFAILRWEGGQASVERLCHLDKRKSKASHGELLSGIYDL